MTDLIQNVQEVYKKWESRSAPNRGRSRNTHFNKSSGRRQYRENDTPVSHFSRSLNFRNRRTPNFSTCKYDNLADFKMTPSVMPVHKPRPFVGIPCAKCFPRSKASIEDGTAYLLGVYNILHIPYVSLKSFNVCCFKNVFNIKFPFPHDASEADILNSKRVEDAIQEILSSSEKDEISNDVSVEKLHQNTRCILSHLKSSISSFCVEIATFFLHHILKRFFNGIFVHKGQMEILKTLHQEGIPFVYLPLYHSYFDYILVSYVLHMHSLQVPFISIVDDLYTPILGYIFRILGAVFIRKDIILGKTSKDILYDAIVKSYFVKCLKDGHSIELFLETQRLVSGKPQTPNTNLLSAVVDSVADGSVEDVYVVPVSITYEMTEGSFVAEQLGSKSKQGTNIFSKLCSMWRIMHFNFGYVRTNFNQPYSIKEFLDTYSKQYEYKYSSAESSLNVMSKDVNNRRNTGKSAAHDLSLHVIYDTTTFTSLMSTHLLAFLFVTQYRKGGTQQQLQNSMDWLRSEIQRKKCDVGFTGESLPVIKRAIQLLGNDLITIETIEMEWTSSDLENNNVKVKIYTPVVKLPYVLELQYYANAVVPIFLKESILVNALYAMVDVDICHFHHCDSRFFVSRDRLVQTAIKLSDFLKYEFITVLPCQDITTAFNDTVDALIDKECLSGANATEGYLKSKKKVYSFDESSDEEKYDEITEQQLKIDLKEESISHLEFLRSILSPYIESYWLAACSLLQLIDEVKEESIFIHEMQMIAQDKLYKGLLAYEESFSAETLKNSLRMFEDQQIIEFNYEDNIKTICLSEAYNSFESINSVIASIEDFRK